MSRVLYRPLSLHRAHSTVWYAERAHLDPPCNFPRGCLLRNALGRDLHALDCEPLLTGAAQFLSRLFTASEVGALQAWFGESDQDSQSEFIVEEVTLPLSLDSLELEHLVLPVNGRIGLEDGWGLSFDVSFRQFQPGLTEVEELAEWVF